MGPSTYIISFLWQQDEDHECNFSDVYALVATTPDEATEKVKQILVHIEIEDEWSSWMRNQPEDYVPPLPYGYKENDEWYEDDDSDNPEPEYIPITWESISYQHTEDKGYLLDEPIEINELLQNTLKLLKDESRKKP